MVAPLGSRSLLIPAYRLWRWCWNRIDAAIQLVHGSFVGFWLGVLDRKRLHALDEHYYDQWPLYRSDEHNRSGLHDWEKQALERFFAHGTTVVTLAAGGGREVMALEELGYEAIGYECHPGLLDSGNSLLEQGGFRARLLPMQRDLCPSLAPGCGGVIIGWSAYSLIQGRAVRVRLLEDLRATVAARTPLLVSFFARAEAQRAHRLAARLASLLRRVLGRPPVELGDFLAPNFMHFFTAEEIQTELSEAGWAPVYSGEVPCRHVVATAAEH